MSPAEQPPDLEPTPLGDARDPARSEVAPDAPDAPSAESSVEPDAPSAEGSVEPDAPSAEHPVEPGRLGGSGGA